MRRLGTAFASGLLFGVGLVIAGMIDPRNVIGFLDVAGRWNPTLAAVMVGAIAVHAWFLRAGARAAWGGRAAPASGRATGGRLAGADGRLVAGAAIFGVGWGLSGYCPGPAVVALGFGVGRSLGFVAAMIAGSLLAERLAGAAA